MDKNNALAFAAYCDKAYSDGWGYVWGADGGQRCSEAYRTQAFALHPEQVNIMTVCKKWDGRIVCDCSGLWHGYVKREIKLPGYSVTHGATSQYNLAMSDKGMILPTTLWAPGMAVFRGTEKTKEHTGIVVDVTKEGPIVVDCRGSYDGTVKQPLAKYGKWNYWGKFAALDYSDSKPKPTDQAPMDLTNLARVVNVKVGLNLRLTPEFTANNTIKLLKQFAEVRILENINDEFYRVEEVDTGTVGYVTCAPYIELIPPDGLG